MIELYRRNRIVNSEVLVCYDISDDKKRDKFFERMKDLGLLNIQNSVFWGYLNAAEERAVLKELQKHTDAESDCGFIIRASLRANVSVSTVGYTLSDFPEDIEYGTI